MIEDYRVSKEKVHVIRPTTNLFDNKCYSQRKEYTKNALFVGYDFNRKGGATLLKAWQEVIKAHPDAMLTIVGPSDLIIDKSIKGVKIVGVVNDRTILKQLYTSSSLFVMPSLFEAFGLVFIEAMNYGLPCIGTDSFSIPEMIRPGYNGWLTKLNDHWSLSNAIIEAFSHLDITAEMGSNAYDFAQSWPTPKDSAQCLCEIIS
jgi:glycosyltransferase involved in cell wall biosynthesis